MVKTRGAKSGGHAERRAAMLKAFRARLAARNLPPPSMRELAASAGVTVPTVRHYFGRRDELVEAVLDDVGLRAEQYLVRARIPLDDFAQSILTLAGEMAMGLAMGMAEIHVLGLKEGVRDDRLGPVYLERVLEPTVLAIEERLRRHQERGDMREADTRVAAVGLLSPLLIVHFHQREMGGSGTRPLEIDAFLIAHVEAFVRAYAI